MMSKVNNRPLLNRRLQGLGTTIFAEMSARAVATGSINLGQGFPDRDGPPEIARAAADAILAGRGNQYPPGPGIPELRHAITDHARRFYDLAYDSDTEVLVTAGATEAVAATMLALVEPGDEVIAFEPYYDSYAANIAMAGGIPVPVTPRPLWGSGASKRRPQSRTTTPTPPTSPWRAGSGSRSPCARPASAPTSTNYARPSPPAPASSCSTARTTPPARCSPATNWPPSPPWPSSTTCSWSPTRSTSTWSSTASTSRS